MNVKIEDGWKKLLKNEFEQGYFSDLAQFVKQEYTSSICYPPGNKIFNAFNHCTLNRLKVVILGQDPYHGKGQANGLCFSVDDRVTIPPSLRNIFKEISEDMKIDPPESGNLERWADQGVLLLNATLTVRSSEPGSHQNKGWEDFTNAVIKVINEQRDGIVFLLWGAYAQKKGSIINAKRHCVLQSPHPSPFSAHKGFLGNRHFSKTNVYLQKHGVEPIVW